MLVPAVGAASSRDAVDEYDLPVSDDVVDVAAQQHLRVEGAVDVIHQLVTARQPAPQLLGHGALFRERQVVALVEEVEALFQVCGVEHRAERGLDALASQRRERDGLATRIDDVQQPLRDGIT